MAPKKENIPYAESDISDMCNAFFCETIEGVLRKYLVIYGRLIFKTDGKVIDLIVDFYGFDVKRLIGSKSDK